MTWAAVAVVASAVIGGVSSNNSAKKAAKGQAKGLAASNAMNEKAIQQGKDYFGIGQKSAQAGFQSSLDFFKNAQPAKYAPITQSSVAAQKVIGQGGQQANNAILGLPVDMSFANQQTELKPDYSAFQNAKLPELGQLPPQADADPSTQVSQPKKPVNTMAPSYVLDPKNQFNNLKPSNVIKNTKKILGRVF
jgi:hypothetical protein